MAALVVDPEHRRQGVGSALWRRAGRGPATGPLRVWATGDSPAARALAATLGLRPVRTLQVLARPLSGDLPPAEPPAGITIRTFRPGHDEDGWLAVNARAFAFHPEQGSLTRTDLDAADGRAVVRSGRVLRGGAGRPATARRGRPATPRDPRVPLDQARAGLAERRGVRDRGGPRRRGARPRHARCSGSGSGTCARSGRREVDLYVEADNARALALYRPVRFLPRQQPT